MSWLFIFFSTVLLARGLWLIPTTLVEARSPLAPYLTVRGALYFATGVIFWFFGIGLKIVVGVFP